MSKIKRSSIPEEYLQVLELIDWDTWLNSHDGNRKKIARGILQIAKAYNCPLIKNKKEKT